MPEGMTVIIGDLPATSQNIAGIIEYNGIDSTEYFGSSSGTSILEPVVKVVVRHNSYPDGSAFVEAVKDKLHRYHDDYFLSILLVGTPMYLGKSTEKLHEFQVIFRIKIKE